MVLPAPLDVSMEVFLLDADTCQVSHSQAEYVSGLRKNARAWADTGVSWKEHDKRAPVRNGPSSYVVRLWGRTRSGLSVCVVVANPVSTSYRRLCSRVHRSKLEALADVVRRNLEPDGLGPAGASVSVLWKHTTNGWESDPGDPDRPALVPWMQFKSSSASVKSAIHGACERAQRQSSSFADIFTPATGEKNVEVHNEVLLQANIRAGSWFVLPASAQARPCPGRVAADLVVQVLVSDLAPASEVQATASTPPVRVLSFDIECYSETGDFPEASQLENPIITIGLYAETFFVSAGAENAVVRALCLGETEASSDYETESFPSEAKLLLAFGRHMRESDADVVVGYNTTLFDWSYITGRVETLKKAGMLTAADAAEIFRMSRVKDKVTAPQDSTVASSAMGDNPLHFARMPGRFEVDLWFHLKRANSTDLPNLKLNTVAEHYLKDAKHDLPPQQIFEAYRSQGAAGRAKIAAYCVQDTKLVLDLVKKLEVVQSVTQMAAVTLVTPHDINFRGQQIRVYSQILRKAHDLNYVVEDTGSAGGARGEEEDPGAAAAASGYVGAHVVDPKVGHYPDPILTLDFASLYPSIMRTWNLSFDTLLRCEQPPSRRRPPASEVPNTSHVFVKASVRRGLLPLILDELLAERKRVRSAMKTCSDPLQLSLMNGMQLALKISANSCYGFTGSTRGILLCREVAEATTGAGRHIIHQTSETLEARWPGASVVYGDTDSCFVRLPEAERSRSPVEVFAIGEEMAREVTGLFAESTEKSYIELEMEKFFCPLVLYKKKRYAGLCYKDPAKPPSMSATGIEMVRRDSAPLLRRAQKEVLDQLVVEGDVDRAVAAAKDAIEAVLATKAGGPFADLAQSKTLRSKYANPNSMVHVRVASLMEQRQPGSAPRSGERVSYLVVASLCARIVDKVDSVEHAEENLLPPDWVHYVGMLVDPLLRLLDVPLQSLAPDKYSAILEYFVVAKRRAAALVHAHALARHGVQWLSGHKVKNGTQLRLDALPGFQPPPPSAAHPLPPVTKKRRRQETLPSSALPPSEQRRGPLDFWLETQIGSNPGSSSAAPSSL